MSGSVCSESSRAGSGAGSRTGSRTRPRSEDDNLEKVSASKLSKPAQDRKSKLPGPSPIPS